MKPVPAQERFQSKVVFQIREQRQLSYWQCLSIFCALYRKIMKPKGSRYAPLRDADVTIMSR
jgi:hypothetical protein